MTSARSSGVLLHPTSLSGRHGIGDLGEEARRFVDWLADARQRYWQILPLVAVDEGGSPYNGLSAMAGNAWLLDLDELAREGLLTPADLEGVPRGDERVSFQAVGAWKDERMRRAHAAFRHGAAPHLRPELDRFREAHAAWLDDYALFRAIRQARDSAAWTAWETSLRDRDVAALGMARAEHRDTIERRIFEQFLFDRQWTALRAYAAGRGIRIIGDIPIFVAHDSADVWAHRELFQLDERGMPSLVAGVPPDYFSDTGQRWGNPLYGWDRARAEGYRWWIDRFRRTLQWVDLVRVDHFRGFESYWAIPADQETAIVGEWRPGPGRYLFDAVARALGALPVIAEDLGIITAEVEELRDALGFPGMRVLQFAFDGDPKNLHLPAYHPERSVAYTGTHDNDTVAGWWESLATESRARVASVLGGAPAEAHWAMIRLAMESPARLAIVPIQDVLGLGNEARMNTPGSVDGNWGWRLAPESLTGALASRLREMAERSGRAEAVTQSLGRAIVPQPRGTAR